jgi:hypothetical protein
MSKPQRLLRVKFKENVNLPGADDTKRGGISDIWPLRSSAASPEHKFVAHFQDGWIVLTNTTHGTKMRYPASMVTETVFEEDGVKVPA